MITVSPGSVVIEYVFEADIEDAFAESMISGNFDVGMPIIEAALPGITLVEGGELTESAMTWEPKPDMFKTVGEAVDVNATINATATQSLEQLERVDFCAFEGRYCKCDPGMKISYGFKIEANWFVNKTIDIDLSRPYA